MVPELLITSHSRAKKQHMQWNEESTLNTTERRNYIMLRMN